jgi:hypothetical protein
VQDAGDRPIDGAIEDEAFLPLADWIANKACAGVQSAGRRKDAGPRHAGRGTLRTLAAPARTLRTLRVDPA